MLTTCDLRAIIGKELAVPSVSFLETLASVAGWSWFSDFQFGFDKAVQFQIAAELPSTEQEAFQKKNEPEQHNNCNTNTIRFLCIIIIWNGELCKLTNQIATPPKPNRKRSVLWSWKVLITFDRRNDYYKISSKPSQVSVFRIGKK